MSADLFVENLRISPLTAERWDDFVRLFGKNGAYGGCWCMWWRIPRSQFAKNGNEGNYRAMQARVQSGEIPGVLGYLGAEAVGWCSIAPRENYLALERSRTLKRVDDAPVWSVVCFFIARRWRGKGLAYPLLRGAMEYAHQQGAGIIEAYPIEANAGSTLPPVSSFMGTAGMFRRLGFVEIAQPGPTRRIMRYTFEPSTGERTP